MEETVIPVWADLRIVNGFEDILALDANVSSDLGTLSSCAERS